MKNSLLLVSSSQKELGILSGHLGDLYLLLTAENAQAASTILRQSAIHLIICAEHFSGGTGRDLCARLQSNTQFSHIPMILLADDNSVQARIKSLNAGIDAHIEKPIHREYLILQVRNLLKTVGKLREHFDQRPLSDINIQVHSKTDEQFVKRLNDLVYDNMQNPELDVEALARLTNMSRPTLYRKMKSISDLTPNEWINLSRLKKAAELLATADYKVFEVATMVGFNSQSSFGKTFLRHFKITPTEYQQQKKKVIVPYKAEAAIFNDVVFASLPAGRFISVN